MDQNIPSNLVKLKENISSLKDKINLYKQIILELTQDVLKIENNCNNYIKSIQKPKKKIKKGFAAPSSISNELISFLKLPPNTKMSRTDVTKLISKYIKTYDLQNNNDKTEIIPDHNLSSLLGKHDDKLTFFTIQKLLNKHFIKP
jgi:chromatin remodeling complex protein RSC6